MCGNNIHLLPCKGILIELCNYGPMLLAKSNYTKRPAALK